MIRKLIYQNLKLKIQHFRYSKWIYKDYRGRASASENRIKEVRNGAVWDNLVIAFFGETNAGKSTIIETFRILFNENSNSSEIGNDGLIVGNGESDYTQIYSEYHMRINGVPFTLIDVPGIEGNESKYENKRLKKH